MGKRERPTSKGRVFETIAVFEAGDETAGSPSSAMRTSASCVSRGITGLSRVGRFRLPLDGVRSAGGMATAPTSLVRARPLEGLTTISMSSNPSATLHVLFVFPGVVAVPARAVVEAAPVCLATAAAWSFRLARVLASWRSRCRNCNSVVAFFSAARAWSMSLWFFACCSALSFCNLPNSAACSCWALVELDRMMAISPLAV